MQGPDCFAVVLAVGIAVVVFMKHVALVVTVVSRSYY
jgi:hypothetical protein